MNKKGFTLVELLATLVILGIVAGITVISLSSIFGSTKDKTEDVFVETLKDSLEMYLDSRDAKRLLFSEDSVCEINKSFAKVKVYKAEVTFDDIINSEYKPLTYSDLVNPANEEVSCNSSSSVNIYRDENYVYYYSMNKADFDCLKNTGVISNLPEGSGC